MLLSTSTVLAFTFNAEIDNGGLGTLTCEDAKIAIEDGRIFEVLKERFPTMDLSLFNEAERAEVLNEWQQLSNVADSRRKFGVSRDGLCLLVAYCTEMSQRLIRENLS